MNEDELCMKIGSTAHDNENTNTLPNIQVDARGIHVNRAIYTALFYEGWKTITSNK
jgi:hypothetical protein